MLKSRYLIFVGLILCLLLLGCGGAPSIDTGSEDINTQADTQSSDQELTLKKQINKKWVVNGLEITIGEVEIQNDKIKVGMTIVNNTKNKLTFYPDGLDSTAVIGNIQLEANGFMTEGDLSGDIYPGVSKSGVIYFLVPKGKSLSPDEVTQFDLHLGSVDDENFNSQDFDVTIVVPQE